MSNGNRGRKDCGCMVVTGEKSECFAFFSVDKGRRHSCLQLPGNIFCFVYIFACELYYSTSTLVYSILLYLLSLLMITVC